MTKSTAIEKVKQPRGLPRRRRSGGNLSAGEKVLTGAGGAIVGGGTVYALRRALDGKVDSRIVDALAILVSGIGAVATKRWARSALAGSALVSLVMLAVDQVMAMSADDTETPANADKPSPDLIKAVKAELAAEAARAPRNAPAPSPAPSSPKWGTVNNVTAR